MVFLLIQLAHLAYTLWLKPDIIDPLKRLTHSNPISTVLTRFRAPSGCDCKLLEAAISKLFKASFSH